MKRYALVIALALTGMVSSAQEYKVAKSSGRLEISEVNSVSIEGYNGNEIIFTSTDHSRENDERAKGLRAVSSMGLEDNTGLGLSIVDKSGVIQVHQLKKMEGPNISIKVPKGVVVSYSHTSPHGDDVEVKNFDGDVEISTVHNSVQLSNVTGKLTIKTVHGDINASLPNVKNSISLVSVHGHVDLAIPVSTKANLKLDTNWGEIFLDPDFKIELEKSGEYVKYSDKLTGKLNGGGTDIELSSTHNNVYLRKK